MRIAHWQETVRLVHEHAERTLREAPAVATQANVQAIVADQLDVAAGTVAELLAIPHITVCCAPPTVLDGSVPPPYFSWAHQDTLFARLRSRMASTWIHLALAPVLKTINRYRDQWGLPRVHTAGQLCSKLAMITQLPGVLEFPGARASGVMYTGPFRDDRAASKPSFPWQRLDRRPLIYASMGTVRNKDPRARRVIAEACADLGHQLVVSLGGGSTLPEDIDGLPGSPIVVDDAPQSALLQRSALMINSAGLSSSLEAIRHGVPIVAIPVAEDQPGVAARLRRAGVALTIPRRRLSVPRLTAAVVELITNPTYHEALRRCRDAVARRNGVEEAVNIIDRCLATRARTHNFVTAARISA